MGKGFRQSLTRFVNARLARRRLDGRGAKIRDARTATGRVRNLSIFTGRRERPYEAQILQTAGQQKEGP